MEVGLCLGVWLPFRLREDGEAGLPGSARKVQVEGNHPAFSGQNGPNHDTPGNWPGGISI